MDLPYCFEAAKQRYHGENGNLMIAPTGRVMLLDDGFAAGTASQSVNYSNDGATLAPSVIVRDGFWQIRQFRSW